MRGEEGFALVITLIITALLVALTAEFADEIYVDTTNRQNFVDGQQASLLADSGITAGIKVLQMTAGGQGYSSLGDQWATPLQWEDESGKLTVSIEEENGKLNLNYITLPNGTDNEPYHGIFARMLKKMALPPDLADCVADWVDEDDTPHPGGAETSYYSALKPPYAAKNARLDTLEEVRLVKGFDAGTLERLRPDITVYADNPANPSAAPININTAPAEVIGALDDGMTDALVSRVVEYRKTTPFQTTAEVFNVPGMEKFAQRLSGHLVVKGSLYRLRSQATVNETVRIIEAVVRIDGPKPIIHYWREY